MKKKLIGDTKWIGIIPGSDNETACFNVAEDGVVRTISAAQLRRFIDKNAGARVVCRCVEEVVDVVPRDARDHVEGIMALIQICHENRLVDLQTLNLLIHGAGHPFPPGVRNPWATLDLEEFEKGFSGLNDSLHDPIAITAEGKRLYEIAWQLAELAEVPERVIEAGGPLSLGIQIRGAIVACHAQQDELKIDDDAVRNSCLNLAIDWRDAAFRRLVKDKDARACFTGGCEARPKNDGQYHWHTRQMQTWLESVVGPPFDDLSGDYQTRGNIWDRLGTRFAPPRRSINGRLVVEDRMERWLDEDLVLEKLANLAELQTAGRLVQLLQSKDRFHVKYRLSSPLRAVSPSLWRLRKWNPVLFQKLIWGARYDALGSLPDLDLRTLSHECEARFGSSRFAQMIRAGHSPAEWLAAEVAAVSRTHQHSLAEVELKLVHAVAIALASGHADAAIPGLIWSQHRLQVDPEKSRRYVECIIKTVPELEGHLEDRAAERLHQCFGIGSDRLQQCLSLTTDPARSSFGNDIRRLGAQELLTRIAPNERCTALLPGLDATKKSRLINDLTIEPVVTSTGRVSRGLNWVQNRTARFSDAADDIGKEVMFDMLKSGTPVLPVGEAEFAARLGTNRLGQFRDKLLLAVSRASAQYLDKLPLDVSIVPVNG